MKRKNKKIIRWIGTTAVVIFLMALGIHIYNFISANNVVILIVSGAVVILFLILGFLSTKGVKRRLKGWLKRFK